jgi:putative endonuclease
MAERWFAYFVRCSDGSLYCGATNDVVARVAKHNAGRGARYTRSRLPVRLVWSRRLADRSRAMSLEAHLKRLTRAQKVKLVAESMRQARHVTKRRANSKRA